MEEGEALVLRPFFSIPAPGARRRRHRKQSGFCDVEVRTNRGCMPGAPRGLLSPCDLAGRWCSTRTRGPCAGKVGGDLDRVCADEPLLNEDAFVRGPPGSWSLARRAVADGARKEGDDGTRLICGQSLATSRGGTPAHPGVLQHY